MTHDWLWEAAQKAAVGVAVSAGIGILGWAWKAGSKAVKAVVWLATNVQALADHLRRVADIEGLDHQRIDVITDALEDSRYPKRGQVPAYRQRRKGDQTLDIEDREGVEALRAVRKWIKAGKPPEEIDR